MSIRAMNRVWADASVIGPRRMLLLAIADYANDEDVCWPSMKCLAGRTCLTVRRVQQLMRELETAGYITIAPATGRGTFNVIRITDCGAMAPASRPNAEAAPATPSLQIGEEALALRERMGEETFALPEQMGEETFAHPETERVKVSAGRAKLSAQTGEETFAYSESSAMGEESFAHPEQKGEETFTQSETERVKVSAQRAKVSARRVKLSAQKGETHTHTRVDPLLILNNNQQQIQKSVLCAAPNALDGLSEQPETLTDRDDNLSMHSRQKTEEHSIPPSENSEVNAASPMPERVQFSRERVRLLAEARDAHPKGEIVPESLHAELFGADFAASSQESTTINLPGAAGANGPTGTASDDVNADSTPSDAPRQSASTPAPRTPDPLRDALSASLAGIKQKMAEARAAAEERAAAEASMPKEEPAPTETPQQRYFNILAWMVGADHTTLSKEEKGQVAQTMGILQKAGYTEADLRTFWHSVWKKDWRWLQKGTHPTLKQVRAEIGKIRVDKQTEALALHPNNGRDANGKPILSPEELEMQKLMREAKERGRVAREAAQNQGLRLPDLQGHEVGLPGLSTGTSGLRESLPLRVPTGD